MEALRWTRHRWAIHTLLLALDLLIKLPLVLLAFAGEDFLESLVLRKVNGQLNLTEVDR